MRPRENLREEHGLIMKVLSRFQSLIKDEGHPREACIHALGTIFDFLEVHVDQCHHGKEETILFPAMTDMKIVDLTNLLEELCLEHEAARGLLDVLRAELRASKNDAPFPDDAFAGQSEKYITLVRTHIRKENARLLPEIEKILPESEQIRIEKAFERFEQKITGLKKIRHSLDTAG